MKKNAPHLLMRQFTANKWGNCGFTFLELTLAVALGGLVFSGVSHLLLSGFNSWGHGLDRMDTIANMRIVLDRMNQEIREATQILLPENLGQPTDHIEFSVPNNDLSGTLSVSYRLDRLGAEIERNYQPVASKINDLSVSFSEYPPVIELKITGKEKDGGLLVFRSKAMVRSVHE